MIYYQNNSPLQSFLNPRAQAQNNSQIDMQQFKQYAMTLSDNSLNQFVAQARKQGISEQDIASGLQFIKSLRQ